MFFVARIPMQALRTCTERRYGVEIKRYYLIKATFLGLP